MLYSIIPGITSYHAYHHIILSIYVYSYSIHSTLHYVALFHYYSYIINVYLMMMMTMMILPSSVPASGPRITSISTGLPLSVPPLDRLFSHTAPAFGSWKIHPHPNIPVHILHFKISSARTVAPTKTLGVRRVIPLRRRVNRTWAECRWIGLYHWAYALPFVLLDTIVQQMYILNVMSHSYCKVQNCRSQCVVDQKW